MQTHNWVNPGVVLACQHFWYRQVLPIGASMSECLHYRMMSMPQCMALGSVCLPTLHLILCQSRWMMKYIVTLMRIAICSMFGRTCLREILRFLDLLFILISFPLFFLVHLAVSCYILANLNVFIDIFICFYWEIHTLLLTYVYIIQSDLCIATDS